jgi:hypothetical protein
LYAKKGIFNPYPTEFQCGSHLSGTPNNFQPNNFHLINQLEILEYQQQVCLNNGGQPDTYFVILLNRKNGELEQSKIDEAKQNELTTRAEKSGLSVEEFQCGKDTEKKAMTLYSGQWVCDVMYHMHPSGKLVIDVNEDRINDVFEKCKALLQQDNIFSQVRFHSPIADDTYDSTAKKIYQVIFYIHDYCANGKMIFARGLLLSQKIITDEDAVVFVDAAYPERAKWVHDKRQQRFEIPDLQTRQQLVLRDASSTFGASQPSKEHY